MRKIFALAGLAIFTVVLLTACSLRERDDGYVSDLDYALAHANQRRQAINQPTEDYITALMANHTPRGTVDLRELMAPRRHVPLMYAEAAIHDIELFFSLLQDIYGAYYYFGGDDVFLPLRDDIISQLHMQDIWRMIEFSGLLTEALSTIIADNHFIVGSQLIGVSTFFFEFGHAFEKGENGFRHVENGLYVTEVAGHNIDDVFRLAIGADGMLYYALVVTQPNTERLAMEMYDITVVFENGETLTETRASTRPRQLAHKTPSLRFEGDIPVVTIRSMGYPDSEVIGGVFCNIDANLFLSFADEIADAPVVIVDIRSNTGGNMTLSSMWLYNVLGKVVPHIFVPFGRDADIIRPDELLAQFFMSDEIVEKYWMDPFGQTVENDQLVILLTDRFTASAGDAFAGQMLNIKNTLVIGQNTAGVLVANSLGSPIFLPNSGLPFQFGNAQVAYPQGHFAEGLGIAPDLWVSGDALTATLAMLTQNR